MKQDLMFIIYAYRDYNEVGMYLALFFCALIYLWYTDQNKENRKFWIYPTLFFMGIIWNPIFVRYVWRKIFDYASFPRMFWLLPVTTVISFAAAQFISERKKLYEKIVLSMFIVIILVLCGKFKYSNEYTTSAENLYHIPQEAVEIADYALAHKDNPKLVLPMELATCIRTYSSGLRLLYGEDATYGRIAKIQGTRQEEVYNQMIQETPDLISANGILQELDCDYVVFDESFQKDYEKLAECGYHLCMEIGQYDVYERDEE